MPLPPLKIIDNKHVDSNREAFYCVARNMGYPPQSVNELVLSHFVNAPRTLLDAGVEYSVPLWKPILLDQELVGNQGIPPGMYLGTLTYRFSDPTSTIQMEENQFGRVVFSVTWTKQTGGQMVSLILSDLKPVHTETSQEVEYSLWGSIIMDVQGCYNHLKQLLD